MKTKPFTLVSWIPFLVSTVVFFATSAPAVLTTNSWTAAGGKWETGANWDNGVPNPGDSANNLIKITPAGLRIVTIDSLTAASNAVNSCLTISNLTMSGSVLSPYTLEMISVTATMTIRDTLIVGAHTGITVSNSILRVGSASSGSFSDNGGLTMFGGSVISTNAPSVFAIGDAAAGRMTVLDGTWKSVEVFVGKGVGSQGTLAIEGGTNSLSGELTVGYNGGQGAVWMTGGKLTTAGFAAVIGAGGAGQMTMSNGTWLALEADIGGGSGQGTLTVIGGTNSLTGDMLIGYNGGTGAVWLAGGQLSAMNSTTDVGLTSVGQLTVSNGIWQTLQVFVGDHAGSQGTLTVAGGTNTVSSGLVVGNDAGATGAVWLTGGQLTVTNDFVYIGESGVGQMTVSNGASLAEETVLVSYFPGSQGTLTVAGGTNSLSGGLVVANIHGSTGAVWMTDGQLTAFRTEVSLDGHGIMTVSNGLWQTSAVFVGFNPGSEGTLTMAGGKGLVFSNVTIGTFACGGTDVVSVVGGELRVTNAAANAVLDVRSGTLMQSGGTLDIDRLVVTNSCARFIHTGGTLITGSVAPLPPSFDADGDGLPNGYEQAHGLDPFNPSGSQGPTGDADGDGQSNFDEMTAGTDPNNPNSSFRITSTARVGNDVLITWTTVTNKTYRVVVSTGDASGGYTNNFSNLSPFIPIGSLGPAESTTNYLDVGGATNKVARYYRVHLLP